MLSSKQIERINELAKKSKTIGLTDKEAKEQKRLREAYIKTFRQSFKQQLHQVKVVDEKGNDVTPKALKDSKKNSLH
ncbi:DUF896 domain-containing protein [Halalkalibacter sp. APA_J-10(15)]|uniref:DUF896 domain-containing protein n=1 Tax=unclassified Halalkalibacter TaxID=2893063 RepID=UPI001FF4B14E|nr:DUF896 domain-containing protein [Halalkalibacter sp. APA_J-10(15)]MCK0470853.1 DUF896 domain-containing protein [Halalkalibacter sp. APA_J-10(15)]